MSDQSTWLVNRVKEKAAIEHRLNSVTALQATSQDIFQFWGIFGIGKTTLLFAFRDLFNDAGIDNTYVDLGKFTNKFAHIYIIEELASQLSAPTNIAKRLSALIQEYNALKQQIELIGGNLKLQSAYANPSFSIATKIEEEFVHFLHSILDERPVIMLFDRVECLTLEVRDWLEKLYERARSEKRLTLILGGRDRIREWNSRNGKMRAEDPIELSPFNVDETKEHWRRMTLDAPYNKLYEVLGSYAYDFTFGHPFGNICLENELRQFYEKTRGSSATNGGVGFWDWNAIIEGVLDVILDKWLENSTNKDTLKALVRSVAALREFDRDAAIHMMEKMYPDLGRSLKQQTVQGLLTDLTRTTLFSKETSTSFYRMQISVRRLIIEEMSRNKTKEFRMANEYARDYYRTQIAETARSKFALPLFRHAVVESLYHQAKLFRLAEASSEHEIDDGVWEQVDFALGEFYGQNLADLYMELCDELATLIEHDEELGMITGKNVLDRLLERLKASRNSIPNHTHYDVFISYNSREEKEVKEYTECLITMGITPWLDKWEITPSSRWLPELERIISIVPAAIIMVGRSEEGPWQSMEIDALLNQYRKRNILIGYALMPGCPDNFQGREMLNLFQRVDLRQNRDDQLRQLATAIKNRNR